MNITKVVVLLAVVLLRASAQTDSTAIFSTDGQPTIKLDMKLEPEKPRLAWHIETGTASRDKRFQRFLYDRTTHEYAGYSLTLEKVSSSEYRVVLGRLSLNPAERPLSDPSARLMPSPASPPPQVVHFGEKFAINFFENPKTGQKLVDYVWLERRDCESETQTADCLDELLANANTDLQRAIQTKITAAADRKAQQKIQGTLQQSQTSWELYRDDACSALPSTSQQVDCKVKLTKSRIHDVQHIY